MNTIYAGRQHGRFLPDGAAGHREIPGNGHEHESARANAAARRRGPATDAQDRCRRTVSDDDVLADCDRRRERESAVFIQLRAGWHQRNRDAARVRTKATSCCAARIEKFGTGAAAYGRWQPRTLVHEQGSDDESSPARWRVAPARRSSPGRTASVAAWFPGHHNDPGPQTPFLPGQHTIEQTDIVMLLTPRIIRTHEYTARDLSPIYVGTNQNFGLTGPPPLIAAPPVEAETAPAPGAAAPAPGVPPQGLPVPTAPQGGTPGLVTTPGLHAAAATRSGCTARRSAGAT